MRLEAFRLAASRAIEIVGGPLDERHALAEQREKLFAIVNSGTEGKGDDTLGIVFEHRPGTRTHIQKTLAQRR
jgi:hypothetical protein